jgi:hypothetical protein
MLQYLIHDILPGFNLPKLCLDLEGLRLNSLTSEMRYAGDNYLISDRSGMISLYQDSGMWRWVLYDDLTSGLVASSHRTPLPYKEAVRLYLQV